MSATFFGYVQNQRRHGLEKLQSIHISYFQGLLAENFLEGSASQLTYHGLCELNNAIREEELCVFFRNNHFGTLYKRQVIS